VSVRTEAAGRDEYPAICALVHDGAIQVSDGGDVHRASVTLGLKNVLAAAQRVGIVHDRVHAAIAREAEKFHLDAVSTELPLEELPHQVLEVLPRHRRDVRLRL